MIKCSHRCMVSKPITACSVTRWVSTPHGMKCPQRTKAVSAARPLERGLQWLAEGQRVRPGLRQLRPEDLPPGVTAARGYDHRGHCVLFAHETLGELGKIVIMKIPEGKMVLQAELCKGQDREESPLIKQKKHVFEQVVATVNNCFDENLPE